MKSDIGIRIQRLLTGPYRCQDFDRLFLDLRGTAAKKSAVREIGDFIAHRDERNRGPITEVTKDVVASARLWFFNIMNIQLSESLIKEAIWSNFRLSTDQQLKEITGLNRTTVRGKLKKGFAILEAGHVPKPSYAKCINDVGGKFIWRPAFTTEMFNSDLSLALSRQNLLNTDLDDPRHVRFFELSNLHAIAAMHGSKLEVDKGTFVQLFAGRSNAEGYLEVKAQVEFTEVGKPVFIPTCMFWTTLSATKHCDHKLLDSGKAENPWAWDMPLELNGEGKLCLMQ